MPFLREISIEGLFGLYDHSLELRQDPPLTIVAGPNGIGKTTLLALSTALAKGAYHELARSDFERLTIVAADKVRLSAAPLVSADEAEDGFQLLLRQTRPGAKAKEQIVTIPPPDPAEFALPSFIEPYGPGTFVDTRDGEILGVDDLPARYTRHRDKAQTAAPSPEWFDSDRWLVNFIETKRLDTLMTRARSARRRRDRSAPIHRYLEFIAEALERARRDSAMTYQARTRTFARRLLTEYSRKNVNADALRARYARVGQRASTLAANGLLSDDLDVLPEGKLNPTEKRILDLFLDDFETKLMPLDPVSAKIDQLRAVVEHKFLNKSLGVDPRHGVVFLAEPHQSLIDPDSLSSGEQHEIALISRLLFDEAPGTTVLIDEPELSLHVSWQHEMVEDLEEIARVANLSFVLATHSTAIINGRWDLVEELGPLDLAPAAPGEPQALNPARPATEGA